MSRRSAPRRSGAKAALFVPAFLSLASSPARATNEPAALLTFPVVIVDSSRGVDTTVEIANTSTEPIGVRCFYEDTTPECVEGQPGESCVPDQRSCAGFCRPGPARSIEFFLPLTGRQPLGFRVGEGRSEFYFDPDVLGPDGHPAVAPEVPSVEKDPFLGILRCLALGEGGAPGDRNVLIGNASIETTVLDADPPGLDAARYDAFGLAAHQGAVDDDEVLVLGGDDGEYEACPGLLVVPALTDGAVVETGALAAESETRLALVQCGQFLFGTDRRVSIAQFFTYNEFDQRFSTSRRVDGQLFLPLSSIDTMVQPRSIFHAFVQGTLSTQVTIEAFDAGLVGIGVETRTDVADRARSSSAAFDLHVQSRRTETDFLVLPVPPCAGDCDGDLEVVVGEVVLGVDIALGRSPIEACRVSDADENGKLTIDEVVRSIDSSLGGCLPPLPSPTVTPEPTPALTPSGDGPEITYLGVATADDVPLEPDEIDGEGRPVYRLPTGHGMTLVVEVRPGRNGRPIGTSAFRYDPDDPGVLPDLRLIVSRALGDGSPAVCDVTRPNVGGVPATDPFEFAETQEVSDAINDLGCRADDGQGRPFAHRACTRTPSGTASLLHPAVSQRQFCVPIAKAWEFGAGSTVVAAQVRDVGGTLGRLREMVVLVEGIR